MAADLGPPAVLVNNAGVIRDNLLFKMSEDDWDTVLGVHLRGAFLMSQAAQKYMVEATLRPDRQPVVQLRARQPGPGQLLRGQGRACRASPRRSPSSSARSASPRTRSRPGFIVTDMTASTAARVGMGFEDFQAAAAGQIPVRRVGQPDDVAHTISFLASEGAGFVSGQVIYVAGGPLC